MHWPASCQSVLFTSSPPRLHLISNSSVRLVSSLATSYLPRHLANVGSDRYLLATGLRVGLFFTVCAYYLRYILTQRSFSSYHRLHPRSRPLPQRPHLPCVARSHAPISFAPIRPRVVTPICRPHRFPSCRPLCIALASRPHHFPSPSSSSPAAFSSAACLSLRCLLHRPVTH